MENRNWKKYCNENKKINMDTNAKTERLEEAHGKEKLDNGKEQEMDEERMRERRRKKRREIKRER